MPVSRGLHRPSFLRERRLVFVITEDCTTVHRHLVAIAVRCVAESPKSQDRQPSEPPRFPISASGVESCDGPVSGKSIPVNAVVG